MTKDYAPINDDLETNPDRENIQGEYSTFDRELSRAAKELERKYNELAYFGEDEKDESFKRIKKEFAKKIRLEYKKAAQNLAGHKGLTQEKVVVEYFRRLRTNIMNAILNNEILLDRALRFKELYPFEKESFITILDRILSDNMYHVDRSQVFYSPDNSDRAAYFSKRGFGVDKVTSIGFNEHVETLDECINDFAHEFSHKITSEKPNLSPFGAQAAHIARKFYISSEEDKAGYGFNADELLSFAVQEVVSKDFEKDLRTAMLQREIVSCVTR